MAKERRPGKDRSEATRTAGEVLGLGLNFALATLLFLLGGSWLDERWGTEPMLTLLGGLVGASAGFWSLYSKLVLEPAEADRERKAKGDDGE